MTMFFSGKDNDTSEVHLGRMLQILREFSADPILSIYVIDDVWEYMKAMKVCYNFVKNRVGFGFFGRKDRSCSTWPLNRLGLMF